MTLYNRACIGRNLAMMQLHIILATLFRRYDYALKSDAPPVRLCLSTSNLATGRLTQGITIIAADSGYTRSKTNQLRGRHQPQGTLTFHIDGPSCHAS